MSLPLYVGVGKMVNAIDHPAVRAVAEAVAYTFDLMAHDGYYTG